MREQTMVGRWLSAALLLAALGCGDDPAPAAGGGKGAEVDDDSSDDAASGAGGDPGLAPTATSGAGPSGGGGEGGAGAQVGGAGGAGGGSGAGQKPFGAKCADDAECASATCHKFGKKGKRCTETCKADGDCPDESLGCGEASVCKPPAAGGQ
jgi:hypothetical protein